MNRAFLIILVPAILVALVYLAAGWGYPASTTAAAGAVVLAGAVLVWRRHQGHSENRR